MIRRIEVCKVCNREHEVYPSRKPTTYCSINCKRKDYKFWHAIFNKKYIQPKKVKVNKYRFKWKTATKKEKLDRIRINFEANVIKKDGCWDWKKSIKKKYASIKYENRQTSAHRISWLLHFGEIPEGLFVCHKCDNARCTNPTHLFLGIARENVLDMINKDRHKNRPFGENHKNSKLTEIKVKEIKKLINLGVPMSRISKDFNISQGSLIAIKNNITWKHVI